VPSLHALYGLVVSSNVPIPGAPDAAGDPDVPPDVTVHFDPARADRAATLLHRTPVFTLSQSGADYVFDFSDGVRYVVSGDGARIDASWPAPFTAGYAATYLMNVVMAFVMRLRGYEVLHASAALIGGAAVAFIGPSGAGKSTIAAALALRGFGVIAEDVVAIVDRERKFDVVSSHARVRLWPDVAALLFGSEERLPLIANADWKRAFDAGDRFASGRFELAAIYSIDDRREGAPRVESLDGRDALLDLIAASYKSAAPDTTMSPAEFERLGRIARHVPMRLVVPGTDLATMPAMIDAIIENVRDDVRIAV
jgi:hypothetical protein